MMSSSVRALSGESVKCSGWFGIFDTSAATEPTSSAIRTLRSAALVGGGLLLDPPPMYINALLFLIWSGLTMVIQCFHTGLSTSFSLRQVCEVSSRTISLYPCSCVEDTCLHP